MTSYLVLILCSLTIIIASISNTALAVAFPVLSTTFGSSLIATGWVISISSVASTAAMPIAGKASDILGRKFIYICCMILFILGSFLSAIAPNIECLIFFRLLQGLGAGGFMPSTMGLMADLFPQKRQQMIGLITSVFMIGQVAGPVLGGWLTAAYGWRAVFWINIPFGIIGLAGGAWLLKSANSGQSKMDLPGAGLFTGTISALMVGLSMLGSEERGGWAWAVVFLVICGVLGFWFVRHEKRAIDPVFDLQIIRARPFLAANIFNFVFGVTVIGIFSLIPLYSVKVYALSTLDSGLIMIPQSLGTLISSVFASIFMLHWGYRWPMILGTLGLAASAACLGLETQEVMLGGVQVSGIFLLVLILFLSGLTAGLVAPTSNLACIELMPQRVSTISGIRGMARHTGGALGVTISTLLMHLVGDIPRGFIFILFGTAGILVLSIPLIFAMPAGASAERREASLQMEEKAS